MKFFLLGQQLKEETGGGVGEAYVRAGVAGLCDQQPQHPDAMVMAKMMYVTLFKYNPKLSQLD